ncbi:LTA synthase family protein [Turneriella parva]|uniref:Sulfatase n=1 Tax=Turneriella parva (strain ATCC BAA-1111 / DSM 21527 / NCTC 11395 / H) TaxID=869212 RepID=I4B9D3_TURPD|nr:alkaline phosphatase family protein [Turneriella parva]AFM13890.1 sulfatase [Turneriella parva DSM 21527]
MSFAIRTFALLFFWHLCWRFVFSGVIRQSGFASDGWAFFKNGFVSDLVFVTILTGALLLIDRWSKRAGRFASYLLFGTLVLGFIFVTGYFQIFEKPAEFATVGAGLGTIAAEFFHSALKEISPEIATFAVGLLLSWALIIARHHSRRLGLHFGGAALALPVIAILVSHNLMIFPEAPTREAARWQGSEHTNPFVYALLKSYSRKKVDAPPQEAVAAAGELWRSRSVLDSAEIPATQVKRKHYNVIFYIMESTSSKYTSMVVKGKQVMPVFQNLRKQAFVTRRHYSQFPLSVNARYNALMSAYNPPNKNWLPMSEPNFPAPTVFEVFKDAGYRTAVLHTASLDNWSYRDFLKNRRIDYQADMVTLAGPGVVKTSGFSIDDRAYIAPAMKFIADSKEKPWFITFIPVMPHHPYTIPFAEYELYSPAEIEATPSRSERLLKEYLNGLHYADATLGELVRALENANQLDDTLLCIFADHGEAFYQHAGNYLHALQLYEENVAIPFIIYNRKLFAEKKVYPGISRNIDVAPTALDLAGIKAPPSFMGVSLVRAHRPNLAYFHTDWENDISGLRDGNFKYIYRATENREELYDLAADPDEKHDLITKRFDIAAKLRSEALKARQTQRDWYMKYRGR